MARRIWSDEEIIFLEENWGKLSLKAIAKKLDRTSGSIITKKKRLKIGSWVLNSYLITITDLARAFGYKDANNFRKKLINLNFTVKKKLIHKKKISVIDLNTFWKELERDKEKFNFARLEQDILGKEPSWVSEKRRIDRLNPSKLFVNREWTKEEDILLIAKLKNPNCTYKSLAEDFNRTEHAIQSRLKKLRIQIRPEPRKNEFWDDKEKIKFEELKAKGYDACSISKILNRSELSIQHKISIGG
ncbi:hypothetical protein LI063_05830 [Clostridium perfringens]|uniref:hypothetical protein n=1 Tax=Clostridium perfringens TaxID=1502 RepID=UPI0022476108|nr:hypothetical protein [Clostridium perfringens]MCX0363678.1 hypothetical protein [Clostridium perfringens]